MNLQNYDHNSNWPQIFMGVEQKVYNYNRTAKMNSFSSNSFSNNSKERKRISIYQELVNEGKNMPPMDELLFIILRVPYSLSDSGEEVRNSSRYLFCNSTKEAAIKWAIITQFLCPNCIHDIDLDIEFYDNLIAVVDILYMTEHTKKIPHSHTQK